MTKAVQDLMVEVEHVRDAFHAAVYADGDLDAALGLVADDVEVASTPVGWAARGREALRRSIADDVVPHRPTDLAFHRVSRTGDRWRVADETVVSFTHDRPLPWLLPGIAATGRHVRVLATSVVTVRRSRITAHRTLWDLAGLLAGLDLDPSVLTDLVAARSALATG